MVSIPSLLPAAFTGEGEGLGQCNIPKALGWADPQPDSAAGARGLHAGFLPRGVSHPLGKVWGASPCPDCPPLPQCPTFKREADAPEVPEPFAAEAKFFTESRLLQRDVQIILESCHNQNILGTILHPASGAGSQRGRRGPGGLSDGGSSLSGDAKRGCEVRVALVGSQGSVAIMGSLLVVLGDRRPPEQPARRAEPCGCHCIVTVASDSPGDSALWPGLAGLSGDL